MGPELCPGISWLCLSGVTSCTMPPVLGLLPSGEECICFPQSTSASGTKRHPPGAQASGLGNALGRACTPGSQ